MMFHIKDKAKYNGNNAKVLLYTFAVFILFSCLASCVTDSDDDIVVIPYGDRYSRASIEFEANSMIAPMSLTRENLECEVLTARIYVYDATSTPKTLKKILKYDVNNLNVVIPPDNNMAAIYTTKDSFKIEKGTYDFFVLANFPTYPDSVDCINEDRFLSYSAEFLENGITASVPSSGMPMSSFASEYLGIKLEPITANKPTRLRFYLNRIYSKVTLNVGQRIFELKDDQENVYASVYVSSYWFVNLMKQSYNFRHCAKVELDGDAPTIRTPWSLDSQQGGWSMFGKSPWEITSAPKSDGVYIVDPATIIKYPPIEKRYTDLYYSNFIGNYSSEKITPEFSNFTPYGLDGVLPVNVYILENTVYKDYQWRGYCPGVICSASVIPTGFFYYNEKKQEKEYYEASTTTWVTLYLYKRKFYYDLNSLKKLTDVKLDDSFDINKKDYSDSELIKYGIKRLDNVQGTGLCYYAMFIRHLPNSGNMGHMKFGVVRNNHYNITLSKINGIGASKIIEQSELKVDSVYFVDPL